MCRVGIGLRHRGFILLTFVSMTCFGHVKNLNLEEAAVLEKFFHVFTRESEFGYVLYNKKPVCIHGFSYKDSFRVGTPSHKQSVALREGARIWRQLATNNADIVIHICDKEDPLIPGYIHVLAINIPLFHEAVNENLSLFQYVLGPATNSKDLLNAVLSNSYGFHSLLKDDKVLIGKVLGFGIQNALYVSRMENIQDAFERDEPPFLNCEFLTQQYEHEYLPYAPSFGFKSVNEELNNFQKKITLSSEKLTQNNPEFIFGWLKDSKEEQKFISKLENTQRKIQKLISSPSFLEDVLQKLTGEKFLLNKTRNYQFPIKKEEINKVLAKGIWESLQDYDFEFLSYFIEGFDKLDAPSSKIDRRARFSNYRREILEGKKNLEIANHFFEQLEYDKNFQCVVPKELYYKIIKNGIKDTECDSGFVSLNYSIFSPEGHCLISRNNVSINLKNTISGFANGIKGMNVGETREVFMHPKVAYGLDTPSEKCTYLRGVVTLLEIHDCNDPIPPIDRIDLSFLMDKDTLIEREKNYKMAIQEKGVQVARHLKKCEAIDLSIVKNYLIQFYNNNEYPITSPSEQDLINQVHWNIYYGPSLIGSD